MNDLLCNIRTTQVLDDGDTNTQHSLEPSQVFIAHMHKQKPHVLKHTSLSFKKSHHIPRADSITGQNGHLPRGARFCGKEEKISFTRVNLLIYYQMISQKQGRKKKNQCNLGLNTAIQRNVFFFRLYCIVLNNIGVNTVAKCHLYGHSLTLELLTGQIYLMLPDAKCTAAERSFFNLK